MNILDELANAARDAKISKLGSEPTEQQAIKLLSAAKSLLHGEHPKLHDIVRYKKGLAHNNIPTKGQVAFVTEVLATPIMAEGEEAMFHSAHHREMLTMKILVLSPVGDYIEYHVDGRRFEVVPAEELGLAAKGFEAI